MHPCVVCGKTIPNDVVTQDEFTYRNNIVYRKTWRIDNLICDKCLSDGWVFCEDKDKKLHVVQIAPSTEPDKIFTATEMVLEGEAKNAVDVLSR